MVERRGLVRPCSRFLISMSDRPAAAARSVCRQPRSLRAARIWGGLIICSSRISSAPARSARHHALPRFLATSRL